MFGIGMEKTLMQHGYGWFLPKINWNLFVFDDSLKGRSLFGNIHMVNAFKARWNTVKQAKDDFMIIEGLGRLLLKHRNNKTVRRFLLFQMVWVCIQHFRKSVFASIKDSIRPKYQKEAIEGRFILCKANLDKLLINRKGTLRADWSLYCIVKGNKMMYKNVDHFIDFF